MSNAFTRRFQQIVDQLAQGNKKQFAELTGKSPSHIYRICRGAGRPSMAYLQDLYDEFRIDLNWLLTGEESGSQQSMGLALNSDLVYAPKFDVEASAGFGALVQAEEITENFAFNKSWLSSQLRVSSENIAFVNVSGDSMLPTLDDGDMVLVDMSQQQVHHEGIYLLHTDDGLMAKRIKNKNGGTLEIISDNPNYPSWVIQPTEDNQTQIAGKIVWCGRSL